MNQLFDNICRILATPMPRSLALKLIFGGLVSAALAPFAFGDDCTGRPQCGTNAKGVAACCPPGQICCLLPPGANVRPVCCGKNRGCDGHGACAKPSPSQP